MPAIFEIREIFLLFTAIDEVFHKAKFNNDRENKYECVIYFGEKGGSQISFSVEKDNEQLVIVTGGQT